MLNSELVARLAIPGLPEWSGLVILLLALLFVLAFVMMPFSVFGTKSRLDAIEAQLDEVQQEIRSLALRLPEPGMRRRPVAGPDLNEWFRDQFSPRIAAALDGPLFTAYLAGPHQRPAAESDAMELYFHREAAVDAFPQLFESEAEAMAWLRAGQERDGVAPA